MRVQVNSDKTIEVSADLKQAVKEHLSKSFSRYGGRITRVELHFSDLNGARGGADDKRCLMEARPSGMDPMVVTNNGSTLDEAYKGATRKMVRKLTTQFARATRMAPIPAPAATAPTAAKTAVPGGKKATSKRTTRSKKA